MSTLLYAATSTSYEVENANISPTAGIANTSSKELFLELFSELSSELFSLVFILWKRIDVAVILFSIFYAGVLAFFSRQLIK